MAGMLDGRVAIVTGAGRGIGAGVARLLAQEGAKVVVNDFGGAVDGTGGDTGPAAEVVEEIKKNGGEAATNGADVSNFDQAEALVRQAIDTYGKLDVLVNVAGILRDRMVFNLSWEDWDAVIRVHIGGTFNTIRHASAYWRELRNPGGAFPDHQLHVRFGLARGAGAAQLRGGQDGHRGLDVLVRQRLAALRGDLECHQPGGEYPHDAVDTDRAARGRGPSTDDEQVAGQRGAGGGVPGQRAFGLVQRPGASWRSATRSACSTCRRSSAKSSCLVRGMWSRPPTCSKRGSSRPFASIRRRLSVSGSTDPRRSPAGTAPPGGLAETGGRPPLPHQSWWRGPVRASPGTPALPGGVRGCHSGMTRRSGSSGGPNSPHPTPVPALAHAVGAARLLRPWPGGGLSASSHRSVSTSMRNSLSTPRAWRTLESRKARPSC